MKSVKLHVLFAFHTRIRNGKEKNTQILCCAMHHFTICAIIHYTVHSTHIYINKSYSVHARNSTSQLISHSHIFLSQIFLTCTCSSLYCTQIIGDFQREKIFACHTYCSMHLNIFVYYKVHIHPFLASFFIWTFKRQSKRKKKSLNIYLQLLTNHVQHMKRLIIHGNGIRTHLVKTISYERNIHFYFSSFFFYFFSLKPKIIKYYWLWQKYINTGTLYQKRFSTEYIRKNTFYTYKTNKIQSDYNCIGAMNADIQLFLSYVCNTTSWIVRRAEANWRCWLRCM